MIDGFAVDTDELRAAAKRLEPRVDGITAAGIPTLPDVAASGPGLAHTLDDLGRGATCLAEALHDMARTLRETATAYDDCDAGARKRLRKLLGDVP